MPACTRCGGKGSIPCPKCEGQGRIEEEQSLLLPAEGGSGQACPECDGAGIVSCPECNGGREDDNEDDLPR